MNSYLTGFLWIVAYFALGAFCNFVVSLILPFGRSIARLLVMKDDDGAEILSAIAWPFAFPVLTFLALRARIDKR